MTSPRYIDAQRKINEMKPLNERTETVIICAFIIRIILVYYKERKEAIENLKLLSRPYNTPSKTIARARADFSKLLSIT